MTVITTKGLQHALVNLDWPAIWARSQHLDYENFHDCYNPCWLLQTIKNVSIINHKNWHRSLQLLLVPILQPNRTSLNSDVWVLWLLRPVSFWFSDWTHKRIFVCLLRLDTSHNPRHFDMSLGPQMHIYDGPISINLLVTNCLTFSVLRLWLN